MSRMYRILGLLTASLTLVATVQAQTPPAGNDQSKPAATVNGEVITFAELEPFLKRIGPLPVTLPENHRREMQREALKLLIDDLVMEQFLRKQVPNVDKAEVERRWAELEAGQKQQGKTLADLLKESCQTEAQLRRSVTRLVQWSQYTQNRVTDAELQKYYTEFKPFFDRITVRASHVALRVPPTATPAEKEALVAKLKAIRDDILAGKLDFAEAAKKHSQCPTAPEGGDIGTFPLKYVIDEEMARVAFKMKVGDVSDILETDFGLHIVKVTERKPGEPSDYNKVKEDVREFFIEDMHHALLNQQLKAAKIEIHLP